MIWRTHLAGPLSTPTQSPALPAYLFIGDGTTLRSLTACGGEVAQSFPLDGSLAQAPVVVQLESLAFAVFATTSSGSLYRININTSTGELTLGWRRDLRRPSCAADTELASPVVFRRAVGNTAFRTTFAADVVYAAPVDRCGDDHGNRVIALNAVDGATLWIFNNNGTYRGWCGQPGSRPGSAQ